MYLYLYHSFPFYIKKKTQYVSQILGQKVWENSEDPDQMPQNATSELGLHYLPLIQQFSDTFTSS